MHGIPRKASNPGDEEASAAKAVKLRALQSQFMSNHHDKMYNFLLELSQVCCCSMISRDFSNYSAWHNRRQLITYWILKNAIASRFSKGVETIISFHTTTSASTQLTQRGTSVLHRSLIRNGVRMKLVDRCLVWSTNSGMRIRVKRYESETVRYIRKRNCRG